MCGISGVFLKPGEILEMSVLKKMSQVLADRGPDAEGIYFPDPGRSSYGLVHRRLKIIDLSDQANQPMIGPSGQTRIVYNGEIYNFRELKIELEKSGYSFRTQSDTEVILVGFEAWGTEVFKRLNGIFAFGLLDERSAQPKLFLVRDSMGVKPLFYVEQAGRFAFGSTLKPLMQLDWIDRRIESQTLFHFLQFSHIPSPRSIFRQIRQVSPGGWLQWHEGKLSEDHYFNLISILPIQSLESRKMSPAAEEDFWLRKLEESLLQSVDQQRVSDVPVGCFLSGGIDSSLIASAYAQVERRKISTFSIAFREKEYDESTYAREVARTLGTDHHEWIVTPREMRDLIPQLGDVLDQPFADPSILPTLLLMKFARQKVTVGFSGDGGDELFFGYDYHQILYRISALRRVPQWVRGPFFQSMEGLSRGLNQIHSSNRLQQMVKFSEMMQFEDEADLFQYFVGMVGPLRADRVAQLLVDHQGSSRWACFRDWLVELDAAKVPMPWENKIAYVFMKTFMVDTVLTKTDRASMTYGLEARVPFLNRNMLELASQIPFHLKYKKGVKKYLLRELLRKKFPPSIYARKKQGFGVPLAMWLRGELRYLLDEYLGEDRLRREGILYPQAVRNLVKAHLDGKANHSHLLWSLISFQLWKEKYL